MGSDNELYNINADHMAAACAEYLAADQLIYLTDVAGVLDGEKVLAAIACEEIERLVQSLDILGAPLSKTDREALNAAMIDAERQCCRFLRFDLRVEPDVGPIALELTGPEGTEAFLEALLETS